MKTSILISVFTFIASTAWSQNSPDNQLPPIYSAEEQMNKPSTRNLRKNALYVELGGTGVLGSLNYSRIVPFGEKHGLALAAGVAFYGDAIVNASYLYGKTNKFLEAGVGYSFVENFITPQIGYRFQGKKGFLFRATVMYLTDEEFVDGTLFGGLSFGYSF